MRTRIGGVYRVRLSLQSTERQVSSSWLVGALGITYRQADIVSLESFSNTESVAHLLWRRGGEGNINVGDRVAPFMGDLSVIGEGPRATVESVEEISFLSSLSRPVDYKLRVIGSVALIGLVAYLSLRIKSNVKRAS